MSNMTACFIANSQDSDNLIQCINQMALTIQQNLTGWMSSHYV
jgi:hypothetical protein